MNDNEFVFKITEINDTEKDPFQQGYKSASLLCERFNISASQLAKTIEELPVFGDNGQHEMRDAGALQWCREQLSENECNLDQFIEEQENEKAN